jgi:hypothetical protein
VPSLKEVKKQIREMFRYYRKEFEKDKKLNKEMIKIGRKIKKDK